MIHPNSVNIPWKCVGSWCIGLLIGAVSGPLFIAAFIFALWLAGFTVAGVAGGSCAALTQSSIGLVPANSMFSALQALGAGGVAVVNPYVFLFFSICNMVSVGLIIYYQGCHFGTECDCHA
jgi:hypothetical protein